MIKILEDYSDNWKDEWAWNTLKMGGFVTCYTGAHPSSDSGPLFLTKHPKDFWKKNMKKMKKLIKNLDYPICEDCGQPMFEIGATGNTLEYSSADGKEYSVRNTKIYQCPEDKTIAIL